MSSQVAESPRAVPSARDLRSQWLGAVGVVVVLFLVVFGGFIVSRALSKPVGPPIVVGDSVAVQPLSGWEQTDIPPLLDTPRVRLTRGTASLDVTAPIVGAGSPTQLLRRYVAGIMEPEASQLEVSEEIQQVTLPTGDAVRVTYAGHFDGSPTRIEGEVTAAIAPDGTGVLYDAWGPENVFGYSLTDTEHMIEGAAYV